MLPSPPGGAPTTRRRTTQRGCAASQERRSSLWLRAKVQDRKAVVGGEEDVRSSQSRECPLSNRGNPYRAAAPPEQADGVLIPSTTAGDGASWAVEGDASWGTGARTDVLDSQQTEGVVLCVLGERACKDTPLYGSFPVLIVTSLNYFARAVCYYVVPETQLRIHMSSAIACPV